MKKRKATRKQLEVVVTRVIQELQNQQVKTNNLEFCFDTLLKILKVEDKFAKFAKKRIKEER